MRVFWVCSYRTTDPAEIGPRLSPRNQRTKVGGGGFLLFAMPAGRPRAEKDTSTGSVDRLGIPKSRKVRPFFVPLDFWSSPHSAVIFRVRRESQYCGQLMLPGRKSVGSVYER